MSGSDTTIFVVSMAAVTSVQAQDFAAAKIPKPKVVGKP